jgi:hypothetical protein
MRYATNPLSPPAAQIYKTRGTQAKQAGGKRSKIQAESLSICSFISQALIPLPDSAAGLASVIDLFINAPVEADLHYVPGSNIIFYFFDYEFTLLTIE